jgi:hypothetical protein
VSESLPVQLDVAVTWFLIFSVSIGIVASIAGQALWYSYRADKKLEELLTSRKEENEGQKEREETGELSKVPPPAQKRKATAEEMEKLLGAVSA